jgi:hypothetical protein
MRAGTKKEYCPTCGHIIANQRNILRLSTLEFRRRVHEIPDKEKLIDAKEYLVRFIGSYKVSGECANDFLQSLEEMIESHDTASSLADIKIWILSYISNAKEAELYKFLQQSQTYQDSIDEPFANFYDCYAQNVDEPLNKNRVSRALTAFGLKPIMKKTLVDGKRSSCIKICATKEELAEAFRKNGLLG